MKKSKLHPHTLLLSACLLPLFGGGCSTGNQAIQATPVRATGRGSVQIKIQWPTVPKGRLIPSFSQIIQVTLDQNGVQQASGSAPRPTSGTTSTITIPNVPAGDYTENATAYPTKDTNGNPTGNPQATGFQQITVTADMVNKTADLVMDSTITSVLISPASPSATAGGAPITLSASATDGHNVVLTSPSNFKWTLQQTTVGTLTPNADGTATFAGLAAGTATVSVKETESGVSSAFVPIQVTASTTPPPTTPNILIADYGNNRIVGLDAIPPTTTVTYNDSISGKPFGGVAGVVRDSSGRIYVGDFYTGIVRIDDFTGKNRVVYAPAGIGVDAIYVDKAGKIYWTDINATINRVDDMTGKNRVTFGNRTTLGYNINSIAVDSSNRVYIFGSQIVRINDITNNDTSSANVTSFGGSGAGINQFAGFGGLAMDSKNRIYVADAGNSRIVRIDDMTGLNWTEFDIPVDAGAVAAPNSVAVDSSATPSIYFLSSTVFRMTDMAGTGLTKLGTLTNGAGALNSPSSLSVK